MSEALSRQVELIQRLSLEDVEFRKIRVERTGELPDVALRLGVSHSVEHEVTADRLIAFVTVSFTAGDPESDVEAASAELQIAVSYAIAPGPAIEEEAIEAVSAQTGLFNAWPYAREVLSSALARCGIHGVLLPLLKPSIPLADGDGVKGLGDDVESAS